MQIRSGQANEQVFAKRLIDNFRKFFLNIDIAYYHSISVMDCLLLIGKDAATVGLRPYDGSYSFQQLELYLYSKF